MIVLAADTSSGALAAGVPESPFLVFSPSILTFGASVMRLE